MALHVGRAKHIILQRGKEASQTALGRALFATFFRMDLSMSVTVGNPVFLDESWWTNDPLINFPYTLETETAVVADVVLSKLTVIIAKLTLLKRSAATRRARLAPKRRIGKIPATSASDPARSVEEQAETSTRQQLEARIRQQVAIIESELEAWYCGLPAWFCSTQADVSDENDLTFLQVRRAEYIHPYIPIVLSWAEAAKVQLWRIANPDARGLPPSIFRIVVRLLNLFLQIPESADFMIIPNVWMAGLFLRDPIHREWLQDQIRKRIESNDFFFWRFCLRGLHHGWATSGRKGKQPFISLPEGAQEIVPGVSENMYRAEGIMNLLALDLESLGEDGESQQPLYRFPGETTLFGLESDDSEDDSCASD